MAKAKPIRNGIGSGTSLTTGSLIKRLAAWIEEDPLIDAAILFGSSARPRRAMQFTQSDKWSDIDLQLVTTAPKRLERLNWARLFSDVGVSLSTVRPASGSTRKVTVLFKSGQADLVIVPIKQFAYWKKSLDSGRYTKSGSARIALNEIFVCIHTGYRFLKGERKWGAFYKKVLHVMPGVRIGDAAAAQMADQFIVDLIWVLQKLARGELIAAQHLLHRSLSEIMLRLMREHSLRRGIELRSFGLGRHAERVFSDVERSRFSISARLDKVALQLAANRLYSGLIEIMKVLNLEWSISPDVGSLIANLGKSRLRRE